jgi:phage replication O-like protein O
MENQNFTRIPNEFLDNAAHFKLPVECWQCLMFIMRRSWGWNRKTAELRIKDIAKGTGLRPQNVIRATKRLQNDKFIDVISIDNKRAKKYRINYKYELSRFPEEKLSQEITKVISTDNKSYLQREQNVISTDNIAPLKSTADKGLHEPKERKENIKKNKKSAKAEKEFKSNSFPPSLSDHIKRKVNHQKRFAEERKRKSEEKIRTEKDLAEWDRIFNA